MLFFSLPVHPPTPSLAPSSSCADFQLILLQTKRTRFFYSTRRTRGGRDVMSPAPARSRPRRLPVPYALDPPLPHPSEHRDTREEKHQRERLPDAPPHRAQDALRGERPPLLRLQDAGDHPKTAHPRERGGVFHHRDQPSERQQTRALVAHQPPKRLPNNRRAARVAQQALHRERVHDCEDVKLRVRGSRHPLQRPQRARDEPVPRHERDERGEELVEPHVRDVEFSFPDAFLLLREALVEVGVLLLERQRRVRGVAQGLDQGFKLVRVFDDVLRHELQLPKQPGDGFVVAVEQQQRHRGDEAVAHARRDVRYQPKVQVRELAGGVQPKEVASVRIRVHHPGLDQLRQRASNPEVDQRHRRRLLLALLRFPRLEVALALVLIVRRAPSPDQRRDAFALEPLHH
eukprot:31167-Pelagococcus_subviridis.AAC.4